MKTRCGSRRLSVGSSSSSSSSSSCCSGDKNHLGGRAGCNSEEARTPVLPRDSFVFFFLFRRTHANEHSVTVRPNHRSTNGAVEAVARSMDGMMMAMNRLSLSARFLLLLRGKAEIQRDVCVICSI